MNLKKYLQKRTAEHTAQQAEFDRYRELCPKCWRSLKACFCQKLKPFETIGRFCILMHPKEAQWEKVGTGRLTNVCLKNSLIIKDECFNENRQLITLLKDPHYYPILLYPGRKSHNISKAKIDEDALKGRIPLYIIIDATWTFAKNMMRDSVILHHLPRVSFDPPGPSQFIIKKQPSKFCLSTIESVFHLLEGLDHHGMEKLNGHHQVCLEALKFMVEFQLKCASDPSIPGYRRGQYKDQKSLPDARKWKKRNVVFEEDNFKHDPFLNGV